MRFDSIPISSGCSTHHGQPSWAVVLQFEVLISKFLAIDRSSASSITTSEVSAFKRNETKQKREWENSFCLSILNHDETRHNCILARKIHLPWIMKFEMMRWNLDPLYPSPFGLVASWAKFSAVLGTVSPNKPTTMRPAASPPIVMSKKTFLVTSVSLRV